MSCSIWTDPQSNKALGIHRQQIKRRREQQNEMTAMREAVEDAVMSRFVAMEEAKEYQPKPRELVN